MPSRTFSAKIATRAVGFYRREYDMTFTIDLSPELVRRLEEEASQRGLAANEYAGKVLEQQLLDPMKITPASNGDSNAWDVLESMVGTVDGPSDWSSELDHYLYGTPKRNKLAQ
jgi:hypothetical protein